MAASNPIRRKWFRGSILLWYFTLVIHLLVAMASRSCTNVVWAALVVATILSVAHAQAEAEWLAAHNAARSAVSVVPLVWNTSAAAFALNWVQTQTARANCPVLEHSPDPNYSRPYGENIAYHNSTSTPTMIVTDLWVAEKQWYDYTSNTCNAPSGESCGHYTQVVWNTTTSVGCASAPCAADATFIYYVCDYYPRGNKLGKWPY